MAVKYPAEQYIWRIQTDHQTWYSGTRKLPCHKKAHMLHESVAQTTQNGTVCIYPNFQMAAYPPEVPSVSMHLILCPTKSLCKWTTSTHSTELLSPPPMLPWTLLTILLRGFYSYNDFVGILSWFFCLLTQMGPQSRVATYTLPRMGKGITKMKSSKEET